MIEKCKAVVQTYWGYDRLRPLQSEAITCVLQGRDSVVVLPTGGGKSLCYQAPAVVMEGTALVVSPLISLMKDQVDALTEYGISAGRLDSTQSSAEQREVYDQLGAGKLKLLYLAPERIVSERLMSQLQKTKLSFIAIDEAHCVSMWGHDFRPEYRQLGKLKTRFPKIAVHAYTATATEPVRQDIAEQLALNDPTYWVGSFDRPNLYYRVEPRNDLLTQTCTVIARHPGESGIVYCIRRADVERMANQLSARGHRAAPYHAGMSDADRTANQDAFLQEKVDIIVATVAFGMGIDKSNVRYVIHAGMPKSLEHYQQESGRAGRDGLDAECCLLYGGGDFGTWNRFLSEMDVAAQQVARNKLTQIAAYCSGVTCRHDQLLRYFGQTLGRAECGACDVCLGELNAIDDPVPVAQKILSCVLRLDQRFGAAYVAEVLFGSTEARIVQNRHDQLSTYGLLSESPKRAIRDWIEQLVGQEFLAKSGDYNILLVTEAGWAVLREETVPCLLKPVVKMPKRSKAEAASWEGVDPDLFQALRELRKSLASDKKVPAYVVFGDAALRDMARRKPTRSESFLQVSGVGQRKCEQYGEAFMAVIRRSTEASDNIE